MKNCLFIVIVLGCWFQTFSCPNYYYPWEKKPDSARVVYQTFKVNKKGLNNLAWLYAIPRKFYNSIVLRFPKNMLQTASFQLTLTHRYFDSTDEWETAQFLRQNIAVHLDAHVTLPNADQTDLYYAADDCFTFYLEQTGGIAPDSFEIEAILIYVPKFTGSIASVVENRTTCAAPATISQTIWRAGLPWPKAGRNATPTAHCIVHHSGDGNGNTNYTDLVRAYYTYHTQVNGWDDIAYNYLIAANGDVYAGRDPEKAGILQDNVQGAHFCGKNSQTMGICMIGEFSSQTPATAAITSLEKLLAWKIHKDYIDPFASFPHPDKNGSLLATIAGHRDGCNTECPGTKLYNTLESVRQNIASCAITKPNATIIVFSNEGKVHVKNAGQGNTLQIFDVRGAKVLEVLNAWSVEEIMDIPPGKLYILAEKNNGKLLSSRVFYHTN